jgi:hypothetical protein
MLNCIIQLQAVVEIIPNETPKALNILAKQQPKYAMPSTKTIWLWTVC